MTQGSRDPMYLHGLVACTVRPMSRFFHSNGIERQAIVCGGEVSLLIF